MATKVRGVRGATTCERDCEADILAATGELLAEVVAANGIDCGDIGSAIFTVTADLTAAFPAKAARELGWTHVPMVCAQEIPVPGSLRRCIRVMLQWNTECAQDQIQHVYLRGARDLRPDLLPLAVQEGSGEGGSR